MNIFETIIYFILFLLNKYLDLKITDKWLNQFENKMINKYVSKTEIPPTEIPIINAKDLTNDLFVKLSNNYRRPIVIRGFMKDAPAVQKWNLEYLNEIAGDFKINTVTYESELEIKEMTFNEFVQKHNEGIYINNNRTLLGTFPKLYDDVKDYIKLLINSLPSTNLRNVHIAHLFIGSTDKKTTGSNMHCAGNGNMFIQVKGQKTWVLIDPNYSCLLKGRVAQNGVHAQTLFDMPDTDISIYPTALKHLPRYEVTLEQGDLLWNAPWWWHRVANHKGLSIGMAVRNAKVTKLNVLNNLLYTLSGNTYLMYNTLTISLYEKYIGKNKNFAVSNDDKGSNNVLYQIESLCKKYNETVTLESILRN